MSPKIEAIPTLIQTLSGAYEDFIEHEDPPEANKLSLSALNVVVSSVIIVKIQLAVKFPAAYCVFLGAILWHMQFKCIGAPPELRQGALVNLTYTVSLKFRLPLPPSIHPAHP